MPPALLTVGYDPVMVWLSYAIASFAGYVALDLAKRVRTSERTVATGWWAAGSVTLGTGIWSMHFVGMLALKLPFATGYDHAVTALSWAAAVAVSAVALCIAGRARLTPTSLATGSAAMGAGICAMHYLGMAALVLQPGIRWNPWLVAASAVVAVAASAAALAIFFMMRRPTHRSAHLLQIIAALIIGAAISGMHYTGMAAAGFPADAACLSTGGLGGERLNLLVAGSAFVLLGLTMYTSGLDSRLRAKATSLAKSLQAANDELHRLAFRDPLTGLPNRLLFEDRVAQAVQRCLRDHASLAVLFIDLDGFKPVNDSFGHALGDLVLRETAQRLAAQARSIDTIARVGGDEFVLLLEGRPDVATAAQVAQRLIDAVNQPVLAEDRELHLSCSVGIAMYEQQGAGDKLIANADAAMYAAKRTGGSTYAFFEPRMDAGVREQVELQRELRQALEQGGQLELHYQPKIRATDDVITGAEALLRWRHPSRGMLSPGLFIPVAERFGLIGALGNWVIEEACRQAQAWRDEGLRIRVAINLSVHQLRQDDLVQRVSQAVERHQLDPALLTFEITESVAMEDGEGTMRAFERLGSIGVQLSIDDFGTGYSSLSYLRRLRAGQLKIDRSFIQDLESSQDARSIVQAVVQLAHALGLSVVAEGVETDGQSELLRGLDCDELQGFLFARPMSAVALSHWAEGVGLPGRVRFSDSAFLPHAA